MGAHDGRANHRGQAMVELALVAPWFFMVLFGIVVLGIGVFYQQQLSNAAREGARFAAIHSATSICPTMSSLEPIESMRVGTYNTFCDPHPTWPKMTPHVRGRLAGLNPGAVVISACWSGYVSPTEQHDAAPPAVYTDPVTGAIIEDTTANEWSPCKIDGHDPSVDASSIGCGSGMPTTDTASNLSESESSKVANRVTVYTCYRWAPPLAGFLLIPPVVELRAVSTEAIQRQQ